MVRKALLIFLWLAALLPMIQLQAVDLNQMRSQGIDVEVRGAVLQPGMVHCEAETTVGELLARVELAENCDLSVFAAGTILKDKDVINVPFQGEAPRVSINTGTLEALLTLPGVGQSTAEKIIAYREENGLFQSLEQLMEVPGIKEKKWQKLADFICL